MTATSFFASAGCSIGKIDASAISFGPTTPSIRYNGDRSLDIPIASGSTSTISVDVPEGTVLASATTGDPNVASLGAIVAYGVGSAGFPVSAKSAGSTPFIVLDDRGREVSRATIHVADTKAIRVDGPDGLTLVSGATYTVHATTMGEDGVVLVGDGAITFGASGSLVASGSAWGFCFGDCKSFETRGSGDGHLHMVANGASADRTFHVVDLASIDAIAFSATRVDATIEKGATIDYSLFAGAAQVTPALDTVSCTSANPSVATVWTGSLGALSEDQNGVALVNAHASGTTAVTCAVGAHSTTAQVTVP